MHTSRKALEGAACSLTPVLACSHSQRFKMHVAASVVNASNASLTSMGTQQLLDLFETSAAAAQPPPSSRQAGGPRAAAGGAAGADGGGAAAVLREVGERWSAEQYEQEYDLQGFLDNLE